MQTQIISYCANVGSYTTGIDIMNANNRVSDIVLTYKDMDGKLIKEETLKIKAWAHKTFKPNMSGRFSIIIEGPDNIIAIRVLNIKDGGMSECYPV